MIVADSGGDRRPPHPGADTHTVRVRVADVDAAFACARDYGAVVLEAPIDREYGERDCTLEDVAGYHWQLAEAVVGRGAGSVRLRDRQPMACVSGRQHRLSVRDPRRPIV